MDNFSLGGLPAPFLLRRHVRAERGAVTTKEKKIKHEWELKSSSIMQKTMMI